VFGSTGVVAMMSGRWFGSTLGMGASGGPPCGCAVAMMGGGTDSGAALLPASTDPTTPCWGCCLLDVPTFGVTVGDVSAGGLARLSTLLAGCLLKEKKDGTADDPLKQ
jgi:hypothetical protein